MTTPIERLWHAEEKMENFGIDIKLVVIPYGYQLDAKVTNEDTGEEFGVSFCRDYGGNIDNPIKAVNMIRDFVHELERKMHEDLPSSEV
jgi:hypothetical protein